MGSKNSPAGSTTSTGTSAPWAPQQPYLESIFGNAQNLYNTGGPQYYPSSTYSAFNPTQLNSLSAIENQAPYTQYQAGLENQANLNLASGSTNATNPAITNNDLSALAGVNQGLVNPGVGTLENFSGGNYLNGGAANPYTQALSQSVLSSVVPSIESQFVQGGGLSSPQAAYATASGATNALAPSLFSNYQTQEQLAQNAASTLGSQALQGGGLQATAAGTLGNLYNTGAQNQLGALAIAPQTAQLSYLGPEQAFNAATSEQGNTQNALNAAVQNWNYNQTLPWQNLNEMIAQVTGNYGGTTSQTQPFYENTGANLGAGALGGGLLGSSLFSPAGLLGGGAVSQGAGKGLGSILGAGLALSDRRMKEDLQKLAELPSGLGIYSFRFKGDDEYHIGLIAQEVEDVLPEAVVTRPSGIKMVNYSAFT